MAAQIVYSELSGAPVLGQLFAGKRFFVAQKTPSRAHFLDSITSNGGEIVRLEVQADYHIADHARADCPPGSLSYRFIEQSLKKGAIEDPEDHPAGRRKDLGSVRPVGGVTQTRTSRVPFTPADDRELWEWVQASEDAGRLKVGGNEMYKELEKKNPRHTHHSWRDRYLKYLVLKPPAGVHTANTPPTPQSVIRPAKPADAPTAQSMPTDVEAAHSKLTPSAADKTKALRAGRSGAKTSSSPSTKPTGSKGNEEGKATERDIASRFTEEDMEDLLKKAHYIEEIPFGKWEDAWQSWADADADAERSPAEWVKFYTEVVRPVYRRQIEDAKRAETERDAAEGTGLLNGTKNTAAFKIQPVAEVDAEATPRRKQAVQVVVPVSTPPSTQKTHARAQTGMTDTAGGSVKSTKRKLAESGVSLGRERILPWKHARLESSDNFVSADEDLSRTPHQQQQAIAQKGPEVITVSSGSSSSSSVTDSDQDSAEASLKQLGGKKDVVAHSDSVSVLSSKNLAQLQTAHRSNPSRRAIDLVEDDEGHDPEEFVRYLQQVTNPFTSSDALTGKVQAAIDDQLHAEQEEAQVRSTQGPTTPQRKTTYSPPDSDVEQVDLPTLVEPPEEVEEDNNIDLDPFSPVKPFDTQDIDPALQMDEWSEDQLGVGGDDDVEQATVTRPIDTQDIDPDLDYDDDEEEELTVLATGTTPLGFPPPSSQSESELGSIGGIIAAARPNTQAILDNIDTQDADLELPLPPEDVDEASIIASPSRPPHSVKPTTTKATVPSDPLDRAGITTFLASYTRAGYREGDIVAALKCTCMRQILAETVLNTLTEGEEIPQDIAGVWTPADDAALEGTDGRALRALEEKQGNVEMEVRRMWLEKWREE
ncbi:hypothetical protein LTR66_014321 [Elasticomyces elasticus]|nr:hypothetical protein LTR66_014321 [Elasticomyces elasticus]